MKKTSPRDELNGIISFERKRPTLQEEAAHGQYVDDAAGGALGGAFLGGLATGGRRGVVAGALLGTGAGLLARKALAKKVEKIEENRRPVDAAIVGRLPAIAGMATAAGVFAGRKQLLAGAERAGVASRRVLSRARATKGLTKMAPSDYVNVVNQEPAGLLKRFRSELEDILEFEAPDLPAVTSWNPFTRHKQNKAFKKAVDKREREDPSAGVTYSDVKKTYKPVHGAGKMFAGAIAGGIVGAAGSGAALVAAAMRPRMAASRIGSTLRHNSHLIVQSAAGAGAMAGAHLGNRKGFNALAYRQRQGHQKIRDEFDNNSVDVSKIKSDVPIATSYGEVARGLKEQKVGLLTRHAAALATTSMRHSDNAAFMPMGDKGIIISQKNAPEIIIRHEQGHAKDYAHQGGRKAWDHVYREGNGLKDHYINGTLLPEERAWAHAGKLSKHDEEMRDAALDTYASAGLLQPRKVQLSARDELTTILLSR